MDIHIWTSEVTTMSVAVAVYAILMTFDLGVLAQESSGAASVVVSQSVIDIDDVMVNATDDVMTTSTPDQSSFMIIMTTSGLVQDMSSYNLTSNLETSMTEDATSSFEISSVFMDSSKSSGDLPLHSMSSDDLFTDDNVYSTSISAILPSQSLENQTSISDEETEEMSSNFEEFTTSVYAEESENIQDLSDFSTVLPEQSSSDDSVQTDVSSTFLNDNIITTTVTQTDRSTSSAVVMTSHCLDCSSPDTSEAISSLFTVETTVMLSSSSAGGILPSSSKTPILPPLSSSAMLPSTSASAMLPSSTSAGNIGSSATAQRTASDNATIQRLQREEARLRDKVSDLEKTAFDLTIATAVLAAVIFTAVALFIFIKCTRYHMNKADPESDNEPAMRQRTKNNNFVAYFRPQSNYQDLETSRASTAFPKKDEGLVSFSYAKPIQQEANQRDESKTPINREPSEQIQTPINRDSELENGETKSDVELRRSSTSDLGMSDAFDALNNVANRVNGDNIVNDANSKQTSFIEVDLNEG